MAANALIVCVLLPRLRLTVAAGARSELLGVPAALAPEPGAVQQVGEPSLAAEAFGIHEGMRLGEALSRCPRLILVPPDPAGVAERWEQMLAALEGIGAAVEPSELNPAARPTPPSACFDARGLLRLYGGQGQDALLKVLTAARTGTADPSQVRGRIDPVCGGRRRLRGTAPEAADRQRRCARVPR